MLDKLTKRELVDDWKKAKDWASTRLITLAGAILTAYQMLPDTWKAAVPPSMIYAATMVTLGAAILGRITQPKESNDGPTQPDHQDPA